MAVQNWILDKVISKLTDRLTVSASERTILLAVGALCLLIALLTPPNEPVKELPPEDGE